MKITNIKTTNAGYPVRKLVLNLDRTVLIGQVYKYSGHTIIEQDNDYWEPVKWTIDKKNGYCFCHNNKDIHNLSLENVWIPSAEEEKPVKNFYTFHKDAWHCKLYKWIFGKEPHKVHPTMCPYFWIMVLVFILFPIILLVKLTGKAGTNFMEACTTYKKRKRDRKRQEWVDGIIASYPTFTDKDCQLLYDKSSKYEEHKYHLPMSIRNSISDRRDNYREEQRQISRQKEREEEAKNDILRKAKIAERLLKEEIVIKKKETRKAKIENVKASKTSKIIGIAFVIISFIIFGYSIVFTISKIASTVSTTVKSFISWSDIIHVLTYATGAVIVCLCGFVAGKYILIPLWKFVIVPTLKFIRKCIYAILTPIGKYLIVVPVTYAAESIQKIEFPDIPIGYYIKKIMIFLFGWIVPIFRTIRAAIRYTVEIFQMGQDMIYNMYKQNCPRITWTDSDQEDNTSSIN